MSTYFKYTRGESFTLSGNDYTGFFTISAGKAYTNKILTDGSKLLDPKQNFFASCYLQQLEFDRVSGSTYTIQQEGAFGLDILNNLELARILDTLDLNNNTIYSALITQNPNIFDISLQSPTDRYQFYCLSATGIDTRQPDDFLTGKTVYTHADPFTASSKWKFLDETLTGCFTVATDSFTYYTATSTGETPVLLGSFTDPAELVRLQAQPFNLSASSQYRFVIDDNIRQFYVMSPTEIQVYDLPALDGCGLPNLVDVLSLSASQKTLASVNSVAVGRNFRVALYQDTKTLDYEFIFSDKFTNDYVTTIIVNKQSILNLDRVLAFDLRKEDDLLVIIGVKDGINRLVQVNVSTNKVTSDKPLSYLAGPRYHYTSIERPIRVECTSFDSNLIFVYTGEWLQTRTLTNPELPASIMTRENLLFLDDYIFDETEERFGRIQIKFNSNKMRSNYPNILNLTTNVIDDRLHMIIHNIGRIYCFKDIRILQQSIPTLPKAYNGNLDCDKNYLGLSLNARLNAIITDTVNLYNNTSVIVKTSVIGDTKHADLIVYRDKLAKDIDVSIQDFYLHENESINTASLQRVFLSIYELQKNIIDSINK